MQAAQSIRWPMAGWLHDGMLSAHRHSYAQVDEQVHTLTRPAASDMSVLLGMKLPTICSVSRCLPAHAFQCGVAAYAAVLGNPENALVSSRFQATSSHVRAATVVLLPFVNKHGCRGHACCDAQHIAACEPRPHVVALRCCQCQRRQTIHLRMLKLATSCSIPMVECTCTP